MLIGRSVDCFMKFISFEDITINLFILKHIQFVLPLCLVPNADSVSRLFIIDGPSVFSNVYLPLYLIDIKHNIVISLSRRNFQRFIGVTMHIV